jgi:Flp pilus assembly pilin Flp
MNLDSFDNLPDFTEPPQARHHGTLILLLGIMGFITAGITGVMAWVMGDIDLRQMNAGLMDSAGMDRTEYGRILGIISVILYIAAVAIYILFWGLKPAPVA